MMDYMERPFKRDRKANFSPEETMTLLEKVQENANVVVSLNRSQCNSVVYLKRKVWNGIALEVSAASGIQREPREVKKKWMDMRCAVTLYIKERKENPLNLANRRPPFMDDVLSIMKTTPGVCAVVDELLEQMDRGYDEQGQNVRDGGESFQMLQPESLSPDNTSNIPPDDDSTDCQIPENKSKSDDDDEDGDDASDIPENGQQVTTADTNNDIDTDTHQATAGCDDIHDKIQELISDTTNNDDSNTIGEKNRQAASSDSGYISPRKRLSSLRRSAPATTAYTGRTGYRGISQTGTSSARGYLRRNPTRGMPAENGRMANGMDRAGDLPQVLDSSNAGTVIMKMKERAARSYSSRNYSGSDQIVWNRWLESEISVNQKRKQCLDAYLNVMELKKRKLELELHKLC